MRTDFDPALGELPERFPVERGELARMSRRLRCELGHIENLAAAGVARTCEDGRRHALPLENRYRVDDAAQCVVERDVEEPATATGSLHRRRGGVTSGAHQPQMLLERRTADRQQVLPRVGEPVVAEDDRPEPLAHRTTSASTARRAASTVSARPKSTAPSGVAASA